MHMIQRDLVIIITDQERYPQHWPAGLRDQLMPSGSAWNAAASHSPTRSAPRRSARRAAPRC